MIQLVREIAANVKTKEKNITIKISILDGNW